MRRPRERRDAPEIEITPEMLNAGVDVCRRWTEGSDWGYRAFVSQIYREMTMLAPKTRFPT